MRLSAACLSLFFVALSACSGTQTVKKDTMMPDPIAPTAGGGASIVEKGDVSGDGKPDVWGYYKEVPDPANPKVTAKILVKKEADLNFDGRKDILREFDDEGVLRREEVDLDFDGNLDEMVVYDKGILREKHIFRSGSSRPFIWKFFEEGKMNRMDRDDNGDGRADYCELWYAGERISKRGWDKDGNGECDYWENAD
jgi:hypothetical protein